MRARVSAPAKVILLGEHAVVHGEPALATAITLRTEVTAEEAPGAAGHRVNGYPVTEAHHAHAKLALASLWGGGPVSLTLASDVPGSAGIGSSAALSCATVGALLALQGKFDPQAVARAAYDVERAAQGGRGSPTDTATSAMGGGVLVHDRAGSGLLWEVVRGERRWCLHRRDLPPLRVVIGYTGERGRTSDQVAKVERFVRRSGFARDVLRGLGKLTLEGLAALDAGDFPRLGRALDRAHGGLTILGVSTPHLDDLVGACRAAGAWGAKLTGAGGGGSMIAIGPDPDALAKAIARARGRAFVVDTGAPGARVESAEGNA